MRYVLYGIELDSLEDEPTPCNVEASIVTNIMALDSLYIFIELYSSTGYPKETSKSHWSLFMPLR